MARHLLTVIILTNRLMMRLTKLRRLTGRARHQIYRQRLAHRQTLQRRTGSRLYHDLVSVSLTSRAKVDSRLQAASSCNRAVKAVKYNLPILPLSQFDIESFANS